MHSAAERLYVRGLTVVAVALALGCSASSPVSPEPPGGLPDRWLEPGPHVLYVFGADLQYRPTDLPPCEPFATPRASRYVKTRVVVARDGAEVTLRPMPAEAGALEIRFRHDPRLGIRAAVGSAAGCAADQEYAGLPVTDVTFCAVSTRHGAARLRARVSPDGSVMTGTLEGLLTFADSAGVTGRCPVVQVILSRN